MDRLDLSPGSHRTQRLLELAHSHMGLELTYVAEFTGGRQLTRYAVGDLDRFGLAVDTGPTLDQTFCQRMVTGQIPNVINDATSDARVADLVASREGGVGAYIGVPLRLPDGTVYGSFCCLSGTADDTLDERAVRFLSMLADMMAVDLQVERERDQERMAISSLVHGEQIGIACQPIVDLRTGSIMGLEALARFPEPFQRPDQTFARAHELDRELGIDLEGLALQQALKLLPSLGTEQYLSVNLSPAVLTELINRDKGAQAELPLSRIVVEITEHEVINNYAALTAVLRPYRDRGLRISIDDAGAGYASFHHVVELGPDFIKVDRSLVDGLAHDRARRVAVTGFVLLAVELGCTVIAEGVEQLDDLAALRDMGVEAAQGYLLGRPSESALQLAAWTAGQVDVGNLVPGPRGG